MSRINWVGYQSVLAIGLLGGMAFPAISEELDAKWQPLRDHYNMLSDKACAGSYNAERELRNDAMVADNLVAKNDLGWLFLEDSCPQSKPASSLEFGLLMQRNSAKGGYPVAMNSYAHRLMLGDGEEQDSQDAVAYFERAIEQGYGTAAVDLAQYYLKGEHIEQSYGQAVELLRFARSEGQSPKDRADKQKISELAKALDNVNAQVAGETPRKVQDTWKYSNGTASWEHVVQGRLRARVFVRYFSLSDSLTYGLFRPSNDPMVNFMGVSVSSSETPDQELEFGQCGGGACLSWHEPKFDTGIVNLSIPLSGEMSEVTLEKLKSGGTVTFRYQTLDRANEDNFLSFTLSLKGSREAIELVEQYARYMRKWGTLQK